MMKMTAQQGNAKVFAKNGTKNVGFDKWWPAIIVSLCFFIYANTIHHKYAYDDKTNIYSNTVVQKGIAGLPEIVSKGSLYGWDKSNFLQYRPVLLITFAIEKSIFGQNPTSGHLINILLYGILCVCIFWFLLDVLSAYPDYVSALITLLFVVHPLHTEAVANIKGRDEILSMLFGILSLSSFLKFYKHQRSKYLLGSLVCYFLSIHSKESGYLFLGLVPLLMYFFTPLRLKAIVKNTVPYLIIAALGISIRLMVLDSLFFGESLSIHENSLTAAKTTGELFATRFTIVLYALKLLFFPFSLSCDYSYNTFPIVSWNNFGAIASLIIHVSLLAVAVIGIRKKNIYAFAIIFYMITYFMSSNLLFNIGSTFGERFLFAPSLAFCIIVPFIIASLFKLPFEKKLAPNFYKFIGVFATILVVFGFATVKRNKVWYNDSTLFESGVKTAPNSVRMHYTYANHLFFVNEAQNFKDQLLLERTARKALSEYTKANEILPEALHFYEMGLIYTALGNENKSIEVYKKCLELDSNFSRALCNYGIILANKNDYQGALKLFVKATKSKEINQSAIVNAAILYKELNEPEQAMSYFKKAIEYNTADASSLQELKNLYFQKKDSLSYYKYIDSIRNRR